MAEPMPHPPAPQPAQADSDWTVQAADRIEAVVVAVRDNTTVPVQKAARALVFGLFAGVMGITALVLLIIGLFRLNVYLPFGSDEARKVWVTDIALGAIFLLVGWFLLRKRNAMTKE
jgi:hypothetical protein